MTEKQIELEECPGQLQWSAFGAPYQDTACGRTWTYSETGEAVGPWLQDLDRDYVLQDIRCPFCDPTGFTEHMWGEPSDYIVIWADGSIAPKGTEIHYHDAADLWWSATHPERGEERVGVRSAYADEYEEDR